MSNPLQTMRILSFDFFSLFNAKITRIRKNNLLFGEVISAVEDVGETEANPDESIAGKRVEEAHDIIHRIARILAMEEDKDRGGGELLAEVPWDGKKSGESIEVEDDDGELACE